MIVKGMCTGCLVLCMTLFAEEPVGKITLIEGTASVMKKESDQWRPARLNMTLYIGDQVYSREESLVEITYAHGEIVRMDEDTKLKLEEYSEKRGETAVPLGRVWVNMKKLSSVGRQFEVSSPTAVAAIRGTIFDMRAKEDSTTEVNVFDGKVAVGPSRGLQKTLQSTKKSTPMGAPHEVPGPEEIPGPYEVTLEHWSMIVAGQQISIRADGKYATGTFDLNATGDSFLKKNRELDKKSDGKR